MAEKEVVADEARWGTRRQWVKATIAGALDHGIADQAALSSQQDQVRLGQLASRLRDAASDETAQDERVIGKRGGAARRAYAVLLLGIKGLRRMIGTGESGGIQ